MISTILKGALFFVAIVGLGGFYSTPGQSNSDSIGTGGRNSIRGRIYLPNGQVMDSSVAVELQSIAHATKTVRSDQNGVFIFTSLSSGSYTIVVDAGDGYEIERESFFIDKETQGVVRVTPMPRYISVPIYLKSKRVEPLKNEVLNAKLALVPKAALASYNRGLEFSRAGKDVEAIKEFETSIRVFPTFARAHIEIGVSFIRLGKLNEAVSKLQSALAIDKTDFDAYLNLGVAYLNQNKYDLAEMELVSAAFLDRTAVTPHYYLGIVFVMKDDLDIARKAFETARDLKGSKNLPSIHKYLGRIYMAKHLDKEAINELETYINLSPTAKDAENVRRDITDLKKRQN